MNCEKEQTVEASSVKGLSENGFPRVTLFDSAENLISGDFGLSKEDQDWLNQPPVGREKSD